MRTITRFVAAILAAIGLSAFAWADIQVDNVSALSGLDANGGGYSFVQFRLDDQRFTVTGAEALGEVVWVKSIGVVQRPSYTIALNSTLRIQQSTAVDTDTGISSAQNAAVIAISQPLASSSTEPLTVGTASQTLRTYTFAAPFPLKKSTLYTASFYNASGTAENQHIAMYRDSTNGTTQNKNTTIHASADANFSPCVRIIAVEPSKLADVGETATWSGLWPEAPAETDTVGLNVTAANATLTMDTTVTVAGLAIGSETAVGPLTLTGSGLTSTTTTIATDTDVSAITANLGTVSIGSGKTLTVGDKGAFTSLTGTGGTLALNATDASISYTNTEAELEALRTYNGKVIFKGKNDTGVTLPYAIGKGTMSAKFVFDGGTHTFQYGVGNTQVLFGPQGTDEDPTLEGTNGATLNFCMKDLSGWNLQSNAEKVILRVGERSTLNFKQYVEESDKKTAYFNNRLVLDNGATVNIQNDDGYFRMNGGVRAEATAQLAMLGGETETSATVKGNKITLAADGSPGVGISVGAKATLTIKNNIEGADNRTFAKHGSGTLVLSGDFEGSPITVNGGVLDFSVAEGTRTVDVGISGAGTVKKSGVGTLSLTGTVSTPVEVAAGTLNLGTQRPTLGAVAEGAILKLTATATEVVEGAMELPTTLLAAPDKARFSVVNGSGNAQEISSVSWTEGRLTLTLRVAEPTFTVTDNSDGAWAGATEWPSSGNVSIAANQLTADKTVTIPAPAEGTRALTQVTVVGNDTAKVTLVVESGVTIATLVPYGYVRVDVATVNALTNAPSVPEGATLEVIAESNATLSKAISGAGTFAKGGAGVLTLGANVATTSGSIVQSGELKFSSNGYINAPASPASNIYADATGDVLVKSGATLNLAGRGSSGGLLLREVTLEENAIFKNETTNIETNQRQLRKLTLLGDAIVVADKHFGLLASGHGETTLTLNGHTLTKRGSGNFWLMNTKVNGGASGGKIVVEAGSITNTVANKPVTFSTPITLESTLTGTPFNLTGADVTASDNLTANGPVNFATLNVGNGKTLAGTGTVTVTDMNLGGALNVTGNLVIDRTGQTDTWTFNNAIKVAAAGSLTTKGNITWGSDSNEFLGSLTVASGTLSIKTPDQKLGGNITIASDAILKIAKTVTTTTTGVITGGGKLVIGDGSTASSVTLNGTLGTVTGEGESALATHSSPIEIGSGSTLIFNSATPTVLTNAAISGAGSLTIAGSRTFTFGEGSYSSYSGATLVDPEAILVLNCPNKVVSNTEVGVLTAETADTAAVTVNGTLKGLKGAFYRQVKGSGLIQVPSAGALTIGRDNSGVTGIVADFTGTIEVASEGILSLPSWSNSVTHAVANCNITNDGTIKGGGGNGGTTTVTISNGKTLKGSGEILPNVTFERGSSLDVSQGAPTLSVVTGTVKLTGYTAAVQPVLKTASEVTFAAIDGYTLPKSGTCYWLVKNTAKVLSAVAPAGESPTAWSALPWKSSDDRDVSPDIFELGLDLTANVSAEAVWKKIALDMTSACYTTIDLTLSGNVIPILYESSDSTAGNFKSLTVTGSAVVETALLNHVRGNVTVSETGALYPADAKDLFIGIDETVAVTKPLKGTGVIGVLANNTVTIASTLGEATNDLATFRGSLLMGRGATLTLTSPIKQELLGDIACADNTSILVIGNGSQASGLVLKGRFVTGQTALTFGGILAISKNSYFTFASTSATTVTGAVVAGTSGTGRLTLGDGSAVSTLTLAGTLGTVADGVATYAGAIEVAAASELRLQPTLATTLEGTLTGAGKVVIGDGTSATKVSLAAEGNTIPLIDIKAQSTLAITTTVNNGIDVLPPETTVNIAENAKLSVDTMRNMVANVTGPGEMEVLKAVTYIFRSGKTNCLAPGKLTLKSGLTLQANRAATGLSVKELELFAGGTLTSTSSSESIAKPVVTVANEQVLSGEGSIVAPIVFKDGAIFDAKYSAAGASLRLTGATITWPENGGKVTVRATKPVQLILFATASLEHFKLEDSAIEQGLYLSEAKGSVGTDVTMSVLKPLGTEVLPAVVSGNAAMTTAIQDQIDAWAGKGYIITQVTILTTQNTAKKEMGSAQAVNCFTNLEPTLVLTPNWEGGAKADGTFAATATVTYDFGVSDITVKSANLTGSAQLYVLVCAKVSNGKTGDEAADYVKDTTTVSLLLNGSAATGAVALDDTEKLGKFGIEARTGEKWFAVPMPKDVGTHKFTVKATNTTH